MNKQSIDKLVKQKQREKNRHGLDASEIALSKSSGPLPWLDQYEPDVKNNPWLKEQAK